MRRHVLLAALLLAVGGCSSPAGSDAPDSASGGTAAPADPPTTSDDVTGTAAGYPDSIAVLGHSGATGENSDPERPGTEARSNSWATGTSPDVRSVYLRLLEENPAVEGNSTNLARGGADVAGLLEQARAAVSLAPPPELVLIQTIDNDIVCPAGADDVDSFGDAFAEVLDVLATGAPDTRIFVVSQFGSPTTYVDALTPEQRVSIGGQGPCAFVSTEGALVPAELERLETIIAAYEAEVVERCEQVPRCTHDGGAFGAIVDRPEHWSSDLDHFSVQGHAAAAEAAWTALHDAGVLPVG